MEAQDIFTENSKFDQKGNPTLYRPRVYIYHVQFKIHYNEVIKSSQEVI